MKLWYTSLIIIVGNCCGAASSSNQQTDTQLTLHQPSLASDDEGDQQGLIDQIETAINVGELPKLFTAQELVSKFLRRHYDGDQASRIAPHLAELVQKLPAQQQIHIETLAKKAHTKQLGVTRNPITHEVIKSAVGPLIDLAANKLAENEELANANQNLTDTHATRQQKFKYYLSLCGVAGCAIGVGVAYGLMWASKSLG